MVNSAELFLALMYAIIMGFRRINKTEILQYNGAFLEMLGLSRFPDQSTLRRFLKRLPPNVIRRLVKLFKDKKYAYHIFVTNLKMSPWRVYLFYSPRATIEKGFSKRGSFHYHHKNIKDVYVYPLCSDFREKLKGINI